MFILRTKSHFLLQDYDEASDKMKELETKIEDLEDNPPRLANLNVLPICQITILRSKSLIFSNP